MVSPLRPICKGYAPLREPFSAAIALSAFEAGFVAAGGGALVGVGATVGITGASLLQLGLYVGFSAASNVLSSSLSKQEAKKASKRAAAASVLSAQQSELRIASRAAVAARQLVVGRVLKSGVLFFERVKGPYLYRGYVVAAHALSAIREVRIGTTAVPLDADGYPTIAPWKTATQTYFRVSTRFGAADQEIDPIIGADFLDVERSFRQCGLSTVVVKMYRGADATEVEGVWGSADPAWLFLVDGARVYDPRDCSQSPADPATWQWSRNAALVMAWWLTHADGGRVAWDDIDIPALRLAADVCDQGITRLDGSIEPRYCADGVIDSGDDPAQVLDDLGLTMLGSIDPAGGRYRIIAGAPREVERTLTEASARGTLDATSARAWRDTVNTVRTSFVAAGRDYAVATGPVWVDEDALAADGTEKSITISLPYVTSVGQVQRIAKHLVARARLGKQIKRGEDIEALRLSPTDVVRIDYTGGLASLSGIYEVTRWAETDRADEYELTLLEYDGAALFGWNADNDEREWTATVSEAA